MQVFLPCRQTAADMTLRFIDVQHRPHLLCKGRIDRHEPVCDILMYGRVYLERYHLRFHCFQSVRLPPSPNRQTNAGKSSPLIRFNFLNNMLELAAQSIGFAGRYAAIGGDIHTRFLFVNSFRSFIFYNNKRNLQYQSKILHAL